MPSTRDHVKMKPILEELSRRTLEAWSKALEDSRDDVECLEVETFMNEPLPNLLDAWADAIAQHQPDWVNAQNAAGVLQYVATTLRQMQQAADVLQEQEDAEWEKLKIIRASDINLWEIHKIRAYTVKNMAAGKNRIVLSEGPRA